MAEVKIAADSGGGSVGLVGPASTTSNAAVQFKLPVADGSANQHLKTDGSGQLGWVTEGVGGKILQVTGWTKTNTASYTVDEGGESAVPMSHSITPSATSSKILVMYSITMGISSTAVVALRAKVNNVNAGGVGTGDDTSDNKRYVSANHYVPDADGRATVNWHWVHSPNTTSSTTYSFSMLHWVGDSRTMYINRSHNDNNHAATHRAASTITLMEIGA